MLNKIGFTEIESISPAYLTKVFELHADGSVTKQTNGYLSHGCAHILELTVPEMLEYLKELSINRSLVYGTPEYEEAIVLSAKERELWNSKPGDVVICRDNKDIRWNQGPGWLMLDHDFEEGREPFTREQLLNALYGVCSALEDVPHIWAPSASSCIYYPDGSEYRGLTSQRVLCAIEKGSDVPRLLRTLNIKLWLNGFGFIRVSSSGAQLVRSIIDICSAQPSRIDFIAGAHCLGGLVQKRRELITGFNLDAPFLKHEDYPTLSRKERREYENLVNLAKRRTARESRRKRAIWVRERVEAQLVKYPEGEREKRREELIRIYGTAAKSGELTGEFPLWCETHHCHVTVMEVLAAKDKFDGCEFADPMEPDNVDRRVAIARLSRKTPTLYTHLHGGAEYVLKAEETKYTTVEKGETMIEEFLEKDLDNKAILVTPGVGKTRAATKDAIQRAESGLVVYAMANHNLVNSTIERLRDKTDIKLMHYYGRWWEHGAGDKRKQGITRNCDPRQFTKIQDTEAKGYSPASIVCRSCDNSPWNSVESDRPPCRYWRQFQSLNEDSRGVIFCTTLSLASVLDHLRHAKIPVKYVYIDEQAASAMINSIEPLSTDELKTVQGYIGKEAFAVIHKLTTAAYDIIQSVQDEGLRSAKFYVHAFDDELSLKEGAEITPDELDILREGLEPLLSAKTDEKHGFYENGVNYNAVQWLHTFCQKRSSKNAWLSIDINDTTGHLKYHLCEIRKLPKTVKLTVLDATGDVDENERLFNRAFETLEVRVGWRGTGIWVKKKLTKKTLQKMTDAQIRKDLEEEFLPRIPGGAQRGFLATTMDCEKRVLKVLRKLTPEIAWKSTHFWGARGLNDFEDCDTGLVYGFSYKNVSSVEDDSRTIFGADSILRKRWCDAQNHNEHYQTAERLRLTRNPGRTLVVIGPLYPIEHLGPPTEIIDLTNQGEYSDVELAAERILDFISVAGFCSKRYAWLLNVCQESETERMLQVQSQFRNLTGKKQDFFQTLDIPAFQAHASLNVSYKSFMGLISTETVDSIISSDGKFWTEVWAEVAARMPSLQKLEVKHAEINKRSFSHGFGSLAIGTTNGSGASGAGIGANAGYLASS